MGYMSAELYYNIKCTLGEGPLWDQRHSELLWVDIDEMQLYFLKDGSTKIEAHSFQMKIGFAAPAAGDNYILGLQGGIYNYNRKSRKLTIVESPSDSKSDTRWNDGKCGPDGCIWGGTMSNKQELDQGKLYRLDQNRQLKVMLDPVSLSNGLAWNNDLGKMYFIDSATRSIQTFNYKKGQASLGDRVNTFYTPEDMGYPDGMTIDEDGMLWVAHWDGHCVARWHPETGQLITKVKIPAPRVTSCIFGDKSRSRLFVTTARVRLSKEQLEKYPLSGSVFIIDTNTKGHEAVIYRES